MKSKIDIACEWAIATANNPAHGYDNVDRHGPDFDCASFVQHAWRAAGINIDAGGTASFHTHAFEVGFIDVTSQINLKTGEGTKKGDIWINPNDHIAMVIDNNRNFAEALSNELGGSTGGEAGDQTGREILIQPWHDNSPYWSIVIRWPEIGLDKSTVTTSNSYLTESQMRNNALYVAAYLLNNGWTLQAIAGILGNMEHESTINSGIWQNLDEGNLSGGLGLTQWTPASKLINWATENGYESFIDIDCQLNRILWEVANGEQYFGSTAYPSPSTFKAFTIGTNSPYEMACIFAWNYERSWVVLYGTEEEKFNLREQRGGSAEKWFTYLSGFDFSGGSGASSKKRGLSRILYFALASE